MIPKLIHQTWKTIEIPEQWKEAVESCKKIHDDYKYILWTHDMMEEFIKKEYPTYYELYMGYTFNIQRCDAFRYFVLYKYGGIYIDLDILCKKKLNDFLHYNIVFAKSSNTTSFTNSFFMARPGNNFIKYCIDNLSSYKNSYRLFGKHLHVMHSTGPYYLSNMIRKFNLKNIDNNYIFTRKEYSDDCNVCKLSTCNGGIYFKHVKGQSSWNSFDSLFYNFMYCNYRIIITVIILVIIMYYIYTKKFSRNNYNRNNYNRNNYNRINIYETPVEMI